MNKFFVHIIESPSANDLLLGRWEGSLLKEALRIMGMGSFYNMAINKSTFREALQSKLVEAWQYYKLPFILHFSSHGNNNGLVLSDGSYMPWDEFKELLSPINKALNNNLCICLSSCEGFYAYKMAMDVNKIPFWCLIGPTKKPTWAESACQALTSIPKSFDLCLLLR